MSDNKKIAKNSLILYGKLFFSTLIGLYTARLVLLELGEANFGLFMVVGGLISLINFLSSTMVTTTYRFISVELGLGNLSEVNKVFNRSLVIHIAVALLLILFGYTIGVWYVKNKLVINPGQLDSALFVLHLTIISTAFSVVSIPYQGILTAMENFKTRAFIEMLNTILRLVLVVMLTFYSGDKLKAYALIVMVLSLLMTVQYIIYALKKFNSHVKWNFVRDYKSYKSIFSFAGWILIGALSSIGVNQGGALVINMFFGTSINAAYGISRQVFGYIMTIVRSMNDAAAPQIMKNSAQDGERSLTLVYKMSKYSFLIMLIPSLALMLNMDEILILWLKKVPDYTTEFTNLLLLNGLIGVLGSGFSSAIQATGRIKQHQIFYSIIVLIPLPLSYVAFQRGFSPYYISVFMIFAQILVTIMQIFFMKTLTKFSLKKYLSETLVPILLVCLILIPFILLIYNSIFSFHVILNMLLTAVVTITLAIFVGLNVDERNIVAQVFRKFYAHKFKK